MLRQGSAARELRTEQEMRADAKAIARRMEVAAAALRRRELEARVQPDVAPAEAPEGTLAAPVDLVRAELDAQVFQILDPEKLAREPRRIITRVAAQFGFTRDEIVGRCRTRKHVHARWAAIAAVRAEHPTFSCPRIGWLIGRDHTTILHALRRMAECGVPKPPDGSGTPT